MTIRLITHAWIIFGGFYINLVKCRSKQRVHSRKYVVGVGQKHAVDLEWQYGGFHIVHVPRQITCSMLIMHTFTVS